MDIFRNWMYKFATDGQKRPLDSFETHVTETEAAEKLAAAIRDDIHNKALNKSFFVRNGKMLISGYFIEYRKEGDYEFEKYTPKPGEKLCHTRMRNFPKDVPESSKILFRHLKYLFYTYEIHLYRFTLKNHDRISVVYKYVYEIK